MSKIDLETFCCPKNFTYQNGEEVKLRLTMTSHRKSALSKTIQTGFEPVLNRYETGFKLALS